eukprot:6181715-Pleurochrysis_carterae.AAC.1
MPLALACADGSMSSALADGAGMRSAHSSHRHVLQARATEHTWLKSAACPHVYRHLRRISTMYARSPVLLCGCLDLSPASKRTSQLQAQLPSSNDQFALRATLTRCLLIHGCNFQP